MGKTESFNASTYLQSESHTDNVELKPISFNEKLFKSILTHIKDDVQKNVMLIVEGS